MYSFYVHKPGFWSNLRFITHHSRILHPESPSQYLETTQDIIHLIEKLRPDICILDPYFSEAHDAIKHCGVRYMILHPLDTRHVAVADQGSGILKLPPYVLSPYSICKLRGSDWLTRAGAVQASDTP